MNTILFSEKQRFTQWWLWLILLVVNGLFVTAFYVQVINGKTFGDKPMSNIGIVIAGSLMLLITVLFRYFS
jgi:magnesium-transporting ATPase (P-type)